MLSQLQVRFKRWLADRFTPDPPRLVHLETGRLVLRELKEQDIDAILAYTNDPQVQRYIDTETTKSAAEVLVSRFGRILELTTCWELRRSNLAG